ncbi:hypothetical protein AMAG_04931 [Allomyces macrogynus ATCC 38327]|uniref:F-box domain-containing protein n=1 Tax=Allomyces macrogynus (strain ATCC 38327) TaxID=578462 RepID=A0A0L0S6H5_ALLM3|nr:hypothetical protein AMAG_04931 [Allomyces macrogynus ATCC 38327]|eukprot:KNE58112.1 hypothetical protein AMAG_04931 [Allomyces macrogynus ATCC 38327]
MKNPITSLISRAMFSRGSGTSPARPADQDTPATSTPAGTTAAAAARAGSAPAPSLPWAIFHPDKIAARPSSPVARATYAWSGAVPGSPTDSVLRARPGGTMSPTVSLPASLAGHDATCALVTRYTTAVLDQLPLPKLSPTTCTCGKDAIDPVARLPLELVLKILAHLDAPALVRLAPCNSVYHRLANDHALWRQLYRTHPACHASKLAQRFVDPETLARLPIGAVVSHGNGGGQPSYPHHHYQFGLAANHHQQQGTSAAHPPHPFLVPQNAQWSLLSTSTSLPGALLADPPTVSAAHTRAGTLALPSPPSSPTAAACAAWAPTGTTATDLEDVDEPMDIDGVGDVDEDEAFPLQSAQAKLDWKFLYRNRVRLECNWRHDRMPMTELKGHGDSVYCIQFDQQRIVSGSRDQTIKVWSLATGTILQEMRGHAGSVLCLQYDATGLLVTGSSDTTVMLWDLTRGVKLHTLSGHTAGVLDVAFNQDVIVSCSKDCTIKVWSRPDDWRVGPVLKTTLLGHRAAVNAIQLRGNTLVSASGDYLVKVWDVASGTHVRDLAGHSRGIACVAFDGRIVVSGSNDKTIRVWDVHTGTLLATLEGHTDLVRTLALDSARGIIVSGSYDQSVRVWHVWSDEMDGPFGPRRHAGVPARRDSTRTTQSPVSPVPPNEGLAVALGPNVPGVVTAASATGDTMTATDQATDQAAVTAPPKPKVHYFEMHNFAKVHSSWVFNVALSSTHLVSASQDQSIVVYDFTQGVDTAWIV